jgi:hypothetical protein
MARLADLQAQLVCGHGTFRVRDFETHVKVTV